MVVSERTDGVWDWGQRFDDDWDDEDDDIVCLCVK